jgi:hypothetical protein
MAPFIFWCSNKFGDLWACQDVSIMWAIYFEIWDRVCGQNYIQSRIFSECIIITTPPLRGHSIVDAWWDRANPLYTLQPKFYNTHFNIILSSKSYLPNFRLSSNFETKICYAFSSCPYVLFVQPILFSYIWSSSQYQLQTIHTSSWPSVQLVKQGVNFTYIFWHSWKLEFSVVWGVTLLTLVPMYHFEGACCFLNVCT